MTRNERPGGRPNLEGGNHRTTGISRGRGDFDTYMANLEAKGRAKRRGATVAELEGRVVHLEELVAALTAQFAELRHDLDAVAMSGEVVE